MAQTRDNWFPGTEGTHFAGRPLGCLADECHGYDLDGNPIQPAAYELDGEVVDLDEFIRVNEFDDATVSDLYMLAVGEEYRFGGGAMPITTLRRIHSVETAAKVCPVFRTLVTGGQ